MTDVATLALQSTPSRSTRSAILDLLAWAAALVLSVVVQDVVLVSVLGSAPTRVNAGDPRVVATLFVQPLVVLPILTLLLRMRGQRWADLGLRLPTDVPRFIREAPLQCLVIVALGYALRYATLALLPAGAGSPLLNLHGSVPAFLVALAYTSLLVGLTEELQIRGLLMDRFATIFGGSKAAWASSVIASSVVFGLLHFTNGIGNVVFAIGMGLVFGVTYLRAGRNLLIVIIAHSAYDSVRVIEGFLR